MTFEQLGLIEPIQKALKAEGYVTPTPIQAQAIPQVLAGKDLLGCAQTGTGKTAAFAIPIIQHIYTAKTLERGIKALILTPTRELAIQIDESFAAYGKFTRITHTVIFGGVGQKPQTDALRRGTDILIATPGRLLDLMNQGFVKLNSIQMFVLDEADRMLDMGFVNDVKKVIAKIPEKRQTLFFSATMPSEIVKLSNTILTNPVKVEVTPVSSTAEKITQSVYFVSKSDKRHLLNNLLEDSSIESALVFTRTKHGADRVVKDLDRAGITAEAIHGNKSQNARQRALTNFKTRKTRVLVATDIAARGIDIDDLTHVFNYELPNVPETYVHRIGRTGRAGASGKAISFCENEERPYLKDIQKLIGLSIPVVAEHAYVNGSTTSAPAEKKTFNSQPRPQNNNNGGNSNSRPDGFKKKWSNNNGRTANRPQRESNSSSSSASSMPSRYFR